jgi:hypothetical protein
VKIAILGREEVSGYYAAALIQRGHEVPERRRRTACAPGPTAYLDCDGCLLPGDEPELRAIADRMAAAGKTVWWQLSEIPPASPLA